MQGAVFGNKLTQEPHHFTLYTWASPAPIQMAKMWRSFSLSMTGPTVAAIEGRYPHRQKCRAAHRLGHNHEGLTIGREGQLPTLVCRHKDTSARALHTPVSSLHSWEQVSYGYSVGRE